MPAMIHRLRTKAARQAEAAVSQLRLTLDELPLPPDVAERIGTILDRHERARNGWSFTMVNTDLYHRVVVHLTEHAKRPMLALNLWSLLFTKLPPDSDEVQASRTDLAKELRCAPSEISECIGELEKIGAVYRKRDGRSVRYAVNPLLGTHLSGAVRARAQATAPQLRL